MAEDTTGGLVAAVAGAIGAAGPARLPFVDVEELDLFAPADPGQASRAPIDAARQAVEAARARGRPRGSSNKRTQKWREYLTSRYAHPLEVLAQMQSRTPAELAAELGCSLLAAGQLIKSAAAELAPYLESKMPTLAVVAMDSGVTLLMPGLNAPEGATMDELEHMAIDGDGLELEILDTGAKVIDG